MHHETLMLFYFFFAATLITTRRCRLLKLPAPPLPIAINKTQFCFILLIVRPSTAAIKNAKRRADHAEGGKNHPRQGTVCEAARLHTPGTAALQRRHRQASP
ncbi:hypothetical protein M6G53_03075 [Serratia nevei]|uniref:hypothetical protein n=1 Tax=Serratia nevei TaxID=2703794 RepID=UPI00209C900B|nr:hypothetical protein [Serratia nevei]MCP1104379.1 hypothetical protein [Serratia nevei]